MCTIMPKTIKEERLRWILPIYHKEVRLVDVAKVCPHSQRSLERWLSAYREYGLSGLVPESTRPKSNPKDTPIRLREKVIELRKDTKLSAMKLYWRLSKEGLIIRPRTIGKIIKTEGLTRKYRVRKVKYRYVKALFKPGELVEVDIKYVPKRLQGKRFFQYTAIDTASRWRYLKIYDNKGNYNAIDFLKELARKSPFKIRAIKTDNDSCFTNWFTGYVKSDNPDKPRLHPLDFFCREHKLEHYLIDPGKPAQNGKVERSHRTDQESFYNRVRFKTEEELKYKIRLWNMYYNDLEHCALAGKTPNEYLSIFTNQIPTKVCA